MSQQPQKSNWKEFFSKNNSFFSNDYFYTIIALLTLSIAFGIYKIFDFYAVVAGVITIITHLLIKWKDDLKTSNMGALGISFSAGVLQFTAMLVCGVVLNTLPGMMTGADAVLTGPVSTFAIGSISIIQYSCGKIIHNAGGIKEAKIPASLVGSILIMEIIFSVAFLCNIEGFTALSEYIVTPEGNKEYTKIINYQDEFFKGLNAAWELKNNIKGIFLILSGIFFVGLLICSELLLHLGVEYDDNDSDRINYLAFFIGFIIIASIGYFVIQGV